MNDQVTSKALSCVYQVMHLAVHRSRLSKFLRSGGSAASPAKNEGSAQKVGGQVRPFTVLPWRWALHWLIAPCIVPIMFWPLGGPNMIRVFIAAGCLGIVFAQIPWPWIKRIAALALKLGIAPSRNRPEPGRKQA